MNILTFALTITLSVCKASAALTAETANWLKRYHSRGLEELNAIVSIIESDVTKLEVKNASGTECKNVAVLRGARH